MIFYPTRKQINAAEYQERCIDSDAWHLIHSVATGKRAVLFPPGGLYFGLVGFLVVIPVAAIVFFLMLTLFSSKSDAFIGSFLFVSALSSAAIHCGFMLSVSLGFIYAQQDLVRYLWGLVAITSGCLVYGLLVSASSTYLLLPLVGSVVAVLMLRLAKSLPFTLYADLMRTKRVYFKHKKNTLKR